MLSKKAKFSDTFLALDPPRHTLGILLYKLRRDKVNTPAFLKPLPCFFVYFHRQCCFSVLLLCSKIIPRWRHALSFQFRNIRKLHYHELSSAGVSFQNLIRQRLFLLSCTNTCPAAVGTVLCHTHHLDSCKNKQGIYPV